VRAFAADSSLLNVLFEKCPAPTRLGAFLFCVRQDYSCPQAATSVDQRGVNQATMGCLVASCPVGLAQGDGASPTSRRKLSRQTGGPAFSAVTRNTRNIDGAGKKSRRKFRGRTHVNQLRPASFGMQAHQIAREMVVVAAVGMIVPLLGRSAARRKRIRAGRFS
jgi:hypothetical protein